MAAALEAERARYEAVQNARPDSSAGLGALNTYYARLNAAAERVKQTEASYQKMYGALPAEIQKLGLARVTTG